MSIGKSAVAAIKELLDRGYGEADAADPSHRGVWHLRAAERAVQGERGQYVGSGDCASRCLILASSSVLCIRKMWLAFSRFNCLRVRRSVRISWVGPSGTKLGRIRPCANRSETQSASFTSVLRPGTFLTCAAFASTSSKSPSDKMCQTGFQ